MHTNALRVMTVYFLTVNCLHTEFLKVSLMTARLTSCKCYCHCHVWLSRGLPFLVARYIY